MRRVLAMVCCTAGLGLSVPPAAGADGGPVQPVQGGTGITLPSGSNLVAVGWRNRTLIQRIRRGDGMVQAWTALRGMWGIPGVTFQGATTGLTDHGRLLVLAGLSSRYPPRTTRLAVFDTRRLRVRYRITLPGVATVDAVPPSGRWVYLIRYTAPRHDTLAYEVRAYDLKAHRLLAKPVVDPRESDEAMRGMPVSRVMGQGARWAYTLYYRPSGAPFIHALDTTGRTARCIDL